MELTLTLPVVVAVITFVVAEITKGFKIDTKFVPLINLAVGAVASFIAIYFKVSDATMITTVFYCVATSMATGGSYDLVKSFTGTK